MSVCIISATNRSGSVSLQVAEHYQRLLVAAGRSTEIVSLADLPSGMDSSDLYGNFTEKFSSFQAKVDEYPDFVFVVPEYNGSIPGILKLFIDACRYPDSFRGKRAALVGIGAGMGGNVVGLQHLSDILEFLGAEVHPERVHANTIRGKITSEGEITDARFRAALDAQVQSFLPVAVSR
ncbi:MAG: NAD(P)H-dependent oxidoreductase [Bacteroidota bacterium]